MYQHNYRRSQQQQQHQQQQQQQQKQGSKDSPIKCVYIDGLVVLKIIKHCHEEGSSSEAQGVLLGLVFDNALEVTNCFPFPRSNDDEDNEEAAEYQYTMIRYLKNVNVDHLQVGWYQCSPYGSQLNKIETIDSQYLYQGTIEESIVLLFDPIRTQRGFLSLKAYRLTKAAMNLCKESDFRPEILRQNKMSFEKFFEEIPIIIRNSHLCKALLLEIDEDMPIDGGRQLLDIGGFSLVEKSLQSHIKSVEDLNKQTSNLRNQIIKQHEIARENMNRSLAKMPTMSEDEMAKLLKPFKLTPLQHLENLLNYSQTHNFCQQSSLYSTQNIGKLFMAKSLHNN
ncbi:Eukaryotic translation initiation factor 3 subunit H [Dermatophagoides pteronyssinus]|uniref:Eukaryotic translation initiation factor 3 subunit H n=2 Tax=Dermatophagoides pteronyssinus TaxID=6956 RepID=A0A6P6Y9E1_DERPT|nr:eukaryotic translation initiation factor 3 subunit H-like [Dermatophagoides pteronyssinus]KAH9424674.1 Eukaryotic translation initiation factor 3 subunit H [Dermatophagoides pteronyssinus]